MSDNILSSSRALILAASFNDVVVSRLIAGAERALSEAGIPPAQQSIIRVPGALELPLALKKAAQSGLFDMYVVLGAVIKGATDHYDNVCKTSFEGVLSVALAGPLALGNGIMTVHSLDQALARADGPGGNLGADAAKAAMSLRLGFLELDQAKKTSL